MIMNALYLVVLVGLGLCVFGLVVADLIDVLGKSKKQKDLSVQIVDIGEWFDDHPLNKRDKQGAYYRQAFNLDLEKEILEIKFNNLQKLHAESMRMWKKENPSASEMELAMLKLKLEFCTVDGGDMKNNTVTLKFDNPDKVAGIKISSKAQIIIERK